MGEKTKQRGAMQETTNDGAGEVRPLTPEVERQLATQIRQAYAKVLAEPMPDKIAELLKQLSKSEQES